MMLIPIKNKDNKKFLNKKRRNLTKYKQKQKKRFPTKFKLILSIPIIFSLLIIIGKIINSFINSNSNIQSNSKTKIALYTIVKKENRYIKDFVEFYEKLGYNHIYFYDNNEVGDESVEDLQIVKDGIKKGFISIISYKEREKHIITGSYYDCYERYNLEYDWISFLDVDEYLILEPKGISIKEFLENSRFKDCDKVKFNWRVFTDNDQLDFEDKPLMERFPVETDYKKENRHVKSTVRGGLDYKKYKKVYSAHCIWNNIKSCSSSGKKTNADYFLWPPDFEYGSLNHYVTKSVREFFTKKYKTKVDVETIPKSTKDYLFDYFFKINKKTKEKVDIFNQIFHTNYQ